MNRIEQLKSTLRIEQVAARYGEVRKSGANYTMRCPFHDDHHPSLTLNPLRQTFKCFACGASGDVITLVMKQEGCDFKEAVKRLTPTPSCTTFARGYPHRSPSGLSGNSPLEQENGVFLRTLLPWHPGNQELTDTYLRFEVGQAAHLQPKAWNLFAGRVIFPLRDGEGKLVGFAGRQGEQGTGPKYINSPASSGFRKGELLYGLWQGRETIRRKGRLFVVEGYKDVLAMHAAGLEETVAVCGTALTDAQLEGIAGLDVDVWLVPDGDTAGQKAGGLWLERLRERGVEAAVVELPEGEDPDSLFARLGAKGLAQWIEKIVHRPSVAEEELMAFLLLCPQYATETDQSAKLFPGEVLIWLERYGMVFSYEPFRLLLHQWAAVCQKDTDPLSELTPGLQTIGETLIERHRCRLEQLLDYTGREYTGRNKRKHVSWKRLGRRLMLLYAEDRVRGHIRRLSQRVGEESIPMSSESLSELQCFQLYYRSISKGLERPGACLY